LNVACALLLLFVEEAEDVAGAVAVVEAEAEAVADVEAAQCSEAGLSFCSFSRSRAAILSAGD
jgi:hypothetical protein